MSSELICQDWGRCRIILTFVVLSSICLKYLRISVRIKCLVFIFNVFLERNRFTFASAQYFLIWFNDLLQTIYGILVRICDLRFNVHFFPEIQYRNSSKIFRKFKIFHSGKVFAFWKISLLSPKVISCHCNKGPLFFWWFQGKRSWLIPLNLLNIRS